MGSQARYEPNNTFELWHVCGYQDDGIIDGHEDGNEGNEYVHAL